MSEDQRPGPGGSAEPDPPETPDQDVPSEDPEAEPEVEPEVEDLDEDAPEGDPDDVEAEAGDEDGQWQDPAMAAAHEDPDPVIDDQVEGEDDPDDVDAADDAAGWHDDGADDTAVVAAAAPADRPVPDPWEHEDRDPTPADGDVEPEPRKRRWGRKVLLGTVLALGALYLVGYALTGTRMPANTTIGGVEVGGMAPADAREAVDDELGPRVDEPIRLVHREGEESKDFEVQAEDAGLAFNLDRSIADAGGARSWDPRRMVALFLGTREHAPAIDVDSARLESTVASISEGIDVEVVEPQITFPDGEPEAREPEEGLVVRADDAARTIRDAYLVQTEPVEVPTEVVEPTVGQEGLEEAMTSIAEPAISAPVTIEVGDEDEIELPVTAYTPALVVRVRDGAMTPEIDPETLAGPLTDSTTGIGERAVDATVDVVDGEPEVIPSQEGVGLQPEEMAEKLVPVLTATGDERVVQIEADVVQPEFTTEDAEALNIVERVSEFETFYPHAEYRNINQGRAAELIDGTLLKPGETFSFNDTVGERTEARGFTTGSVINGGQFRDELGGGVSQVVTTTYNAAFFAGLDDVEHHPHAFYIDRYPVGREATVYFGSLDLKFKNSTDHGVLIKAAITPSTPGSRGTMRVEMWSTKVWDIEAGQSARRNARSPGLRYDESNACVPQSPIGGFDIDIYRTFKQGGETVKSETVTANYQAADRVVCGPPPDDDD